MQRAQTRDPETQWGEVVVTLTDDDQIAEIKDRVFNRAEVTDVIALRYDPVPGIEPCTTAELFINVHRATLCTRRQGWNPSRELALYIAHGCDHLTGGVDDTEAEQRTMRRRELRWLREAPQGKLSDLLI
jgi:probable rRNA maturation factor